jgi:hypothetical protein
VLFEKSQLSHHFFLSDANLFFALFLFSLSLFSVCKEEEKEGAKLSKRSRVNFTHDDKKFVFSIILVL